VLYYVDLRMFDATRESIDTLGVRFRARLEERTRRGAVEDVSQARRQDVPNLV